MLRERPVISRPTLRNIRPTRRNGAEITFIARAYAVLPSLGGAIRRHEEPAVRALEAAMALGLARYELGRKSLLAVGADDFARAFLDLGFGHAATVPGPVA